MVAIVMVAVVMVVVMMVAVVVISNDMLGDWRWSIICLSILRHMKSRILGHKPEVVVVVLVMVVAVVVKVMLCD